MSKRRRKFSGELAVVLVTNEQYSSEHEDLLRMLLKREVVLFCAVGDESEAWEEAMDYLCVNLDISGEIPGAFVNTTSHPISELETAKSIANVWRSENGNPLRVEVIEI